MSYSIKTVIEFLTSGETAANTQARKNATGDEILVIKHRFLCVEYEFGQVPKDMQNFCRLAKRDLDISAKVARGNEVPEEVLQKFLATVDVSHANEKPKVDTFKRVWKVKVPGDVNVSATRVFLNSFKEITEWEPTKADRSRLSHDERRSREITKQRAKGTASLADILWQANYLIAEAVAAGATVEQVQTLQEA